MEDTRWQLLLTAWLLIAFGSSVAAGAFFGIAAAFGTFGVCVALFGALFGVAYVIACIDVARREREKGGE